MKGVQIVGYQNSGKSFLCQEILRNLKEHNLPAGYVKHGEHPLEISAKDAPFVELCQQVWVLQDTTVIHYSHKTPPIPDVLDPDLFWVVEGFKEKILFPRIVLGQDEALQKGETLAVLHEPKLSPPLREKILSLAQQPSEEDPLTVRIDGKKVPLKPFLAHMLRDLLKAFFTHLKDTEGTCLTIHLKQR